MDNSANFKINLEFLGLGNASKAEQSLKSVAECCIDLKALTEPMAKIGKVLESIDRVMLKLSGDAKKSTEHLERMSAESKAGLEKLVSIESEVKKGLKGIGEEAEKAKKKLSLGDSLRSWSDGILSLGTIKNSVTGVLSPVMEAGMARETAAVNFDTLLSDEVKAQGVSGKDFADYLRNTDAAALYGTDTVNQNAQAMLAYGVDEKTTVDVLKSIGDIAMGDAQKMSSLATAFSQMNSLGKLQSQDWKQMVGAGFNPFIQMQKDLGKSAEELDAMMAKGEITADMVKDAFVNATKEGGQFAGALSNVMENTMQGSIAKLSGMWDDLKAKVFDALKPLADVLVPVIADVLMPAISGLVDLVTPFVEFVTDNIDDIGFLIGTVMGIVGAIKLWTMVQSAINALLAMNPLVIVVVSLTAAIFLIHKLCQHWGEWRKSVMDVFPPLAVLGDLLTWLGRHVGKIFDAFTNGGIIEGLKQIGRFLLDCLLAPVQALLEWLSYIPGLGGLAQEGADWIKAMRITLNAPAPKQEKKEEEEEDFDLMGRLTEAVNGGTGGGGDGGTGGGGALLKATGKGNEAIASGGTRNTSINIALSNLVETIAFNGTLEENKDDMENKVVECLQRVLYSATSAV